MSSFGYTITALVDDIYVYCVEPMSKESLILCLDNENLNLLSSCSTLLTLSKRPDPFLDYVVDHLPDIFSGKDTFAEVHALIIETDFSFTVSIDPKKDSSFNPDRYADFAVRVPSPQFLVFESIILDENGQNPSGSCFAFEVHCDSLSVCEKNLRGVRERILFFNKKSCPKIDVWENF